MHVSNLVLHVFFYTWPFSVSCVYLETGSIENTLAKIIGYSEKISFWNKLFRKNRAINNNRMKHKNQKTTNHRGTKVTWSLMYIYVRPLYRVQEEDVLETAT